MTYDQKIECDSCGWPQTAEFDHRSGDGSKVHLCYVCSMTAISLATVHFLSTHQQEGPMAVLLAQCTNLILSRVAEAEASLLKVVSAALLKGVPASVVQQVDEGVTDYVDVGGALVRRVCVRHGLPEQPPQPAESWEQLPERVWLGEYWDSYYYRKVTERVCIRTSCLHSESQHDNHTGCCNVEGCRCPDMIYEAK